MLPNGSLLFKTLVIEMADFKGALAHTSANRRWARELVSAPERLWVVTAEDCRRLEVRKHLVYADIITLQQLPC